MEVVVGWGTHATNSENDDKSRMCSGRRYLVALTLLVTRACNV